METPVRLKLQRLPDGLGVAVEYTSGAYQGIIIPAELEPLLTEFLPTSGDRFLRFWATYADTRGRDAFFDDLVRLATAITSTPELPILRKLAGTPSAEQMFHNSYQAQLMAAAYRRYGAVDFDWRTPRQADFVTATDMPIHFEVKTFSRMTTMEMLDDGVRVSDESTDHLRLGLLKRAEDAFGQVDVNGTVILAVWCNHAGAALLREGGAHAVPLREALAYGSIVVAIRDDDGNDNWLRFDRNVWPGVWEGLCEQIRNSPPGDLRIPLTMGAVSFVSSPGEWIGTGRLIRINNLTLQYSERELLPFVAVGARSGLDRLAPQELHEVWRLATADQATFSRLEQEKPFGGLTYNGDEILVDERFAVLYRWSWRARFLVNALQSSLQEALPKLAGRVTEDSRELLPALGRLPGGTEIPPFDLNVLPAFCNLFHVPYCVSRLSRLTHALGCLISAKLSRRTVE